MPPSSTSLLALAALTLLAGGGLVRAQDAPDARELQREVAAAHAGAVAAALSVQDELMGLVPSLPGWTCAARQDGEDPALAQWLAAIPRVAVACDHGDRSIDLELVVDAYAVAAKCGEVVEARQERDGEQPERDEFALYENESWLLVRDRLLLMGCVAGRVGVRGRVHRSWEALANGPAATDAFVEALVASDPAPLLAAVEEAGLDAALTRLTDALDAQSRFMADSLPALPGWTRRVRVASELQPRDGLPMSPYMILLEAPAASVFLEREGCRFSLRLSGSPRDIPTAEEIARRERAQEESSADEALVRRNLGDIMIWEMADGTFLEATVDGRVVVMASISRDLPCEDDPGIARRLFEEIVARDLSAFGVL